MTAPSLKRKVFLALSFVFATSVAIPQIIHDTDSALRRLEQTDLIDFGASLFRKKKVDRSHNPGDVLFSVIPIAPAASGDGKITVSAINASFYLGEHTNISSIYFFPYTNLKGSYGITLSPNIWLDKNNLNGVGDFRYVHNESPEYGLGTSKTRANPFTIEYKQVRTYFTFHTRIKRFFYMGAGYNYDRFYNVGEVDPPDTGVSDFDNYPYGTGTESTSSSVTFNLLRDNRRNSVNPTNGFYGAFIVRTTRAGIGSDDTWHSVYADARRYYSFSKKRHKVLAWRALYWGTFGDVPYYNLPATFQDISGRAGRGFSTNRFRGKQELYGEAEYRFDITRHGFLGGTVFATAQSFTEIDNKFRFVRPAAGVGLRLKFNRNSDTNICVDFSYSADGFNFYVNLGEYF